MTNLRALASSFIAIALCVSAGAQVTGRVVDRQGHPVVGAKVIYANWVSFARPDERVLTTDANGEFSFKDLKRDQVIQPLIVQLSNGDVFTAGPSQKMEVPEAGELKIKAIAPDGKPAKSVKFYPRWIKNGQHFGLLTERLENELSGVTDENGIATLHHLPRGWNTDIDVRDARYARLMPQQDSPVVGQTYPVQVALERGATIEGRALYADGKPLVGLNVGAQGTGMMRGWGDAITDQDGRFTISQLSRGSYNVAADLGPLTKDWALRAREAVYVDPDHPVTNVVLKLEQGQLINGTVTSKSTGKGVKDMGMGIYGPAHPHSSAWVQGFVTDQNGRFQARVPEGDQYIYLMTPQHMDSYSQNIKVQGGPARVDFVVADQDLDRSRRDEGFVVDASGQPVEGASVYAAAAYTNGGAQSASTDERGHFQFGQPLSSGTTLRAVKGSSATPEDVVFKVGKAINLVLATNSSASASGLVRDQNNHPIAGAKVQLFEWHGEYGLGRGQSTTDQAGHFRFDSLMPNQQYKFQANAHGYGRADSQKISFSPGQVAIVPDLALPVADSFVIGRVVDEAGHPVPGASILEQMTMTEMNADREGKFRIDALPRGTVYLNVQSAAGYGAKQVQAGDRDVLIRVAKPISRKASEAEPVEKFSDLKGKAAPELEGVKWINSSVKRLAALRGKIVVIDFWGTWCGPCRESLPEVQKIHEGYKNRGVVVIGYHESNAEISEVAKFAKEHQLTYAMGIDKRGGRAFGTTFDKYTILGIPTVAVIDQSGILVSLSHDAGEAKAMVEQLVNKGAK